MKPKKQEPEKRPIDQYYETYNQLARQVRYPALLYTGIVLLLFGLVSFVWAIPFPHLAFLGKYNGFVNWASFLIAIIIYYYLRLSPPVSYLMLFMLFGFSYIIIQLEKWQKIGGMPLWSVGVIAIGIGIAVYVSVIRSSRIANQTLLSVKTFIIAPLWILTSVLRKLKVRY
ncbi:hypothetical protein KHS38_18620 [Mucilaginibacter sp. Bleaf8]|uniref:hypothetical protein n=1 Tax=Mucilaginibacter sp. Bleaf8 TaxID=2834430 RepID=UPI001BCFC038|nr:hypothetical protein [Mucilaginibacter sp. Bleaf8]MBS7566430.1 hypothetical protein [Mucilaginibacter sp. Bleaf8]